MTELWPFENAKIMPLVHFFVINAGLFLKLSNFKTFQITKMIVICKMCTVRKMNEFQKEVMKLWPLISFEVLRKVFKK